MYLTHTTIYMVPYGHESTPTHSSGLARTPLDAEDEKSTLLTACVDQNTIYFCREGDAADIGVTAQRENKGTRKPDYYHNPSESPLTDAAGVGGRIGQVGIIRFPRVDDADSTGHLPSRSKGQLLDHQIHLKKVHLIQMDSPTLTSKGLLTLDQQVRLLHQTLMTSSTATTSRGLFAIGRPHLRSVQSKSSLYVPGTQRHEQRTTTMPPPGDPCPQSSGAIWNEKYLCPWL